MKRTSILLPPELRNRADKVARRLGVSFGELVRRALASLIEASERTEGEDSFLADAAVYRGEVPEGASSHHDRHLYGESR